MTSSVVHLLADIASGAVRLVDLTHTLSPDFPTLQLPEPFAQAWGFRQERISHYDENGPAWYWNNLSLSEHTGTHFDAPAHWVTGKDLPGNTVDALDPRQFIAPACVVDAATEVAQDDDWLLTVPFLEAWEARHGRIEAGSWLLFHSGWSRRLETGAAHFVNRREDGPHTPGPTKEAVQWLLQERDVLGFGVETINTDAGQSHTWEFPSPCHTLMHGAGRFGLQCLRNLEALPPKGAVIWAAPLKIEQGSGSPLRVLALVPESART